MKHEKAKCMIAAGALLVGLAWQAQAAGGKEFQATLLAAPGGVLYAAGVEFPSSPTSSVSARIGGFGYEYEDGAYYEEGSGFIMGATARFYSGRAMEGMYFGIGADFVSGTTDWWDWPSYGSTSYSGIAPHIMIGNKIVQGSGVSIEPTLMVAFLPGAVEAGVILGFGVSVGFKF